jgi:hypothetical protein
MIFELQKEVGQLYESSIHGMLAKTDFVKKIIAMMYVNCLQRINKKEILLSGGGYLMVRLNDIKFKVQLHFTSGPT